MPRFQVLQPCIQNFFHPVKLGSPQLAHAIKPRINRVEPALDGLKLRIDIRDQHTKQRGVEQQRNPNRQVSCSLVTTNKVALR
jgi:hypothetical protein